MKTLIASILLFLPLTANAGVYIDVGIGWLENIPVEAESQMYVEGDLAAELNQKAQVAIDSPFTDISIGYRWDNNMHFEINQFGVIGEKDHSITSYKLYKRWEFDLF